MQFDTEATICAVATGHANKCRGAIRMAGGSALAVLQRVQRVPDGLRTRKMPRRYSIDWELGETLGAIPVDVWVWPTERSYTGTPSVEIHTLGNQLILKRILEQLCQSGARLAMPGEFTLRAFLAGRMDLTQCEAVLGVIQAESQTALNIALRQLAGGLSIPLSALRRSLIDLLADLEAGLDFVDEDIEFINRQQILDRLGEAINSVSKLSRQLRHRQTDCSAPKVALLGLPNAGKSSLLNALVQEDAAIVSQHAGTTRDFVRVTCRLEHGEIELIDTAGMASKAVNRVLDSDIERMSQRQTIGQRDQADLILYCIDSRLNDVEKLDQLHRVHLLRHHAPDAASTAGESPFGERVLDIWIVWTKVDLVESSRQLKVSRDRGPTYHTSAIQLDLLTSIRNGLDAWLRQRNDEVAAVAPMTAARCQESLTASYEALQTAFAAADQAAGDEIVASEIRLALEYLGQVAGQVYTDDVLDSLFSRFCIGK